MTQLSAITADLGALRWGVVDTAGVKWIMRDLDGWYDSPDTVGDAKQRSGQHGAWVGPAYLTARAITFTGVIDARSVAARDAAIAKISALPLTPTALLRVDGNPSTQAYVRRQGEIKVRFIGRYAAEVQVPLLAPDPRRYASVVIAYSLTLPTGGAPSGPAPPLTAPIVLPDRPAATGRQTVVNDGNTAAPWTAVIVGPVTNPRLSNRTTGRTLGFNLTVGSGNYLVLDALNGTARLNGRTPRTGYIARGTDWWLLNPGSNDIAYTGTAVGGAASVVKFTPYSCWS